MQEPQSPRVVQNLAQKQNEREQQPQGTSEAQTLAMVPPIAQERARRGEPEKSEEEMQREKLGPRGVPGREDPAKMTPQQEKNTPKNPDPPHTA